jgi:UDP-glucose 4-epimerase
MRAGRRRQRSLATVGDARRAGRARPHVANGGEWAESTLLSTSTNHFIKRIGGLRADPARLPGPKLNGRRILVTGGSGFIGRSVVADLCAAGADIRVVDLQPHPDPSVEIVIGDIADPAVLAAALEGGFDSIVHLAAVTSVLRSLEHPLLTYRTNVAATAALLEAARATGVEALAFASTNAVTGLAGPAPITESAALAPLTPYGSTKAAGEMLMSAYSASYGLRCSCLRMTNVYGVGMHAKDSIVARLMRAIRVGKTFEVYGDGRQVRDYVNVKDVVSAFRLALATDDWAGPIVIGTSESLSVLDVIDAVRRVTGADLAVRHVPAKSGEMPAVVVDPSKALAAGWSPLLRFEDGLRDVWDEWEHADLSTIQLGLPVAPVIVGDGASDDGIGRAGAAFDGAGALLRRAEASSGARTARARPAAASGD